jgi:hypothetical protein
VAPSIKLEGAKLSATQRARRAALTASTAPAQSFSRGGGDGLARQRRQAQEATTPMSSP